MKTNPLSIHPSRRGQKAHTLVEVTMGVGLLGFMSATLFGGMSMTTAETRMARQNLRAPQIMVERMEGIRLFNWDQLLSSDSLCPATFTSSFYPLPNSSGSTGITYYGTMVITNASLNPVASYSNQLRAITVTVAWTNFGVGHQRSMTTYQAQYGMQNYVFNN